MMPIGRGAVNAGDWMARRWTTRKDRPPVHWKPSGSVYAWGCALVEVGMGRARSAQPERDARNVLGFTAGTAIKRACVLFGERNVLRCSHCCWS